MAEESKFEREEIPKIYAALKTAKDAGHAGTVVVQFSDQGGVVSILYEGKKRFK